jgi:hypothetical protein
MAPPFKPVAYRPGIASRTVQAMEDDNNNSKTAYKDDDEGTSIRLDTFDDSTPSEAIKQGLIHGTYKPSDNTADLHVSDKGEGPGVSFKDMYNVAVHLYQRMKEVEYTSGIKGKLMLRPTGAAIVKIVVDLLSAALGSTFSFAISRTQRYKRKTFGKSGSGGRGRNKIESDVLPEHFSALDSLYGENVVSIVPLIQTGNEAYKAQTPQEFYQNMLEKSPAGQRQLERYKKQVSDPKEMYSPGLMLTLSVDQLPAVIKTLEKLMND